MTERPEFVTVDNFPGHSIDLVRALNAAYPHRCIMEGESTEQAHRRAGKRELIDDLLTIADAVERRMRSPGTITKVPWGVPGAKGNH